MTGVTFIVPVRNGAPWIREVVSSIEKQDDGRPIEIIVVDDGSTDGSREIVLSLCCIHPLRILQGEGRGPAAAINLGLREARFPIMCQVDQDVVLGPGWMTALVNELRDPDVAAAQGYYTVGSNATIWARVMGTDLQQRYEAISGRDTSHVCTGNTAYRADALFRVGLFDEQLGYGFDNDMSYRLVAAGYRLRLNRTAHSTHYWRDSLRGYCRQQYGLGTGRLDLVAKHPGRFAGDAVSPLGMMLHPLGTLAGICGLITSLGLAWTGGSWRPALVVVTALFLVLGVERAVAGVRAARRFREPAALLFPVVHLLRDLVWVTAFVRWSMRRLRGRGPRHQDSMRPRPGSDAPRGVVPTPTKFLGLIPAHNEAATLPAVVSEARACRPDLDLLVVDDGSTDATVGLLPRLGVRWLRLPRRMGVGSGVRAGLRYASRLGYDGVVRLDGDGQHRAGDLDAVLEPLCQGRADVVFGSRYARLTAQPRRGAFHSLLAVCLSWLTKRRVTDPTSGFCALGPRAVALLAEHHPTGYPEPELQLLMSRSGLTVVEVPVRARSRLGGRTSLTPARIAAAGARVLLAMVIVPLRGVIGEFDHD